MFFDVLKVFFDLLRRWNSRSISMKSVVDQFLHGNRLNEEWQLKIRVELLFLKLTVYLEDHPS